MRRVLLALVVLAACAPTGKIRPKPTITGVIGPTGGNLSSSDGAFTIVVPPGAVANDVNVTIASAEGVPDGAVGSAWSLGPDGQSFALPVQLDFKVDMASLPSGIDPALLTVARLENGTWNPLVASAVTLTGAIGSAVGLTEHFSIYAVVYRRCTYDTECKKPAQCADQTTCVVPCGSLSDCPAPMGCLSGRCVLTQCNVDSDCQRSGTKCAKFTGVSFCMSTCNDTATCGSDQMCSLPSGGGTNVCQFNECGRATQTCAAAHVCSGDICWPENAGCRCGSEGCPCGQSTTGDMGAQPDMSEPVLDVPNCPDVPAPLVQVNGIPGGNVRAMVVRRVSTGPVVDVMLAGTTGGGLWRSGDTGASWSRVGTASITDLELEALADDGTTFWAGAGNEYTPGALYSSSDGGITWVKRGFDGRVVSRVLVYKGKLWVATDTGVFSSSDQGATWLNRSAGLPASTPILSLDVDDNAVWAGTRGAGVYRAVASAGAFAALNTGLPAGSVVRALKAVKSGATTTSILIGVDNAGASGRGEVYEQTNGVNWVVASQGSPPGNIYRRADELMQVGSTVYAALDWGGGVWSRPATAGSNWTDITGNGLDNRNMFSLAISSDGSKLWIGGYGSGVQRGTTAGLTWTRSNTGLFAQRILSLATARVGNVDYVWAGTDGDGVWRSADGGASFTRMATGLQDGFVYALDSIGLTVYAGTYGNGVFVTTNGGSSWTQINGTGPTAIGNLLVTDIVHDGGGSVFASTDGGGVFRLSGASMWTAVNVGLGDLAVRALFMTPAGQLYAAAGTGIWAFGNNAWTQIGAGLPVERLHDVLLTPTNMLCTSYAPLYCMAPPTTNGKWLNYGKSNTGGNSMLVADGLLYLGGYGRVLQRLDLGATCWRSEVPLDTTIQSMAMTNTQVIIGTNDGVKRIQR